MPLFDIWDLGWFLSGSLRLKLLYPLSSYVWLSWLTLQSEGKRELGKDQKNRRWGGGWGMTRQGCRVGDVCVCSGDRGSASLIQCHLHPLPSLAIPLFNLIDSLLYGQVLKRTKLTSSPDAPPFHLHCKSDHVQTLKCYLKDCTWCVLHLFTAPSSKFLLCCC